MTAAFFKKHFLVIFLSLLVHVVLLLLLLFRAETKQVQQRNITHKAIQSYLYKMPANVAINKPTSIKALPDNIKTVEANKLAKKEDKQELQHSAQTKNTIDESIKKVVASSAKASPLNSKKKVDALPQLPTSSTLKTTKKAPAQASFSSYQQLKNLRTSLNNKMLQQSSSGLQQFRSPSVMHGEQVPVPHSNQQWSKEEIQEKNTARMSNDISITKNADGTCTITREQFLGSPVEASTSGFFCGESKFDKSFREHMKKVQDKIMPNRYR